MKIIHCADLHLDSKMTANLTKEQAKTRKAELLHTFCKMVDYAVEHQVRAIIIAGDLYDKKNISATAKNTVYQQIQNHPQIDFYYLKGNHDAESFLAGLEVIPENLKMFEHTWKTYDLGNVTITGVELDAENVSSIYHTLLLDVEKFNMVTLHGQEVETAGRNKAEKISLRDLKNKGIDYLALGHIHGYKQETLDARGIYCYPGCLEGRGFDECGEHGFVLLDIDEEQRSCKTLFVPFARRNLYTLPVDVTGCMTTTEIAEKIQRQMDKAEYNSDSLVKIVLEGQVDVECEKNMEFLQQQFADDFYFLKIYDETRLYVNYQDFALDESLKGEFVRKVLESDMDEEEKNILIRYGIQALAGEELQS